MRPGGQADRHEASDEVSDEARRVVPLFSGAQLRLARQVRGYSQREVEARCGEAVTSAAISQFECGVSRPSAATLARLAGALEFPLPFFSREAAPPPEAAVDAYFRRLRSTPARLRYRARALAQVVWRLAQVLQRHVRLPDLDQPRHPVGAGAEPKEIEDAANRARRDWDLPAGPIPDVVRLLEQHGIVTARLALAPDDPGAFSVPFPDRPVVILGSDRDTRDRSRLDAAHELGHLVMHDPDRRGTGEAEAQADRFAAAFLMPAAEIHGELGDAPGWGDLVELKRRWGTPLAPLLVRARDLGVLTPEAYTRAMKYRSAQGWRRDEPGDVGPPESPALLARAVRAFEDEVGDIAALAAEAALPLDDVHAVVVASADPRPPVDL